VKLRSSFWNTLSKNSRSLLTPISGLGRSSPNSGLVYRNHIRHGPDREQLLLRPFACGNLYGGGYSLC
jgi:hypothetical protein